MDDPFDVYTDALDAGSRLGIHPESVKRLIRQGKQSELSTLNP